jgi:ubiquinone/menaquinone biosynthesis C-methylase UbiE
MNVFDAHVSRYDGWYDSHKAAYLSELAAVKKVLPKGGSGLEIGVGTGRFAAALGIGTGIDPSGEMLQKAAARGVDVRRGKGEGIPFPDKSFDYVAVIIALCFVKDPFRVLQESARVLRERGRIIIGVIDKESFLGRYFLTKKSMFYTHARFFAIPELTALLQKAGFSRFSYYQTITALPDEMQTVERPKRGFGRGGFVVVSALK